MPPTLIARFADTLSMFSIKAAMPSQRALSNFINSGELYRHIRRVRRIYAERRKVLVEQVQSQLLPYVTFEDTHAGMQLVLKLVIDINDSVIAQAAKEKGINILSLSSRYQTAPSANGLLLGFSTYTDQEICTNVTALREIIERLNKP
jgi:GntR family transcriptional regulator/MocR family aminotransferase